MRLTWEERILAMPSELQLLGWTSRGLRCPDHSLDFQRQQDECFPISLIQMPNGTGKTTTLKLLRAALCGAPEEGTWTPELVRELAPRHSDADSGEFALRLRYNDRRLTIVLRFDFDDGIVRHSTTVGSGLRDGFEPPRELRRFLNRDFVRFFVFDGELAEQLLDRRQTNAQTAIEVLFQLDIVRRMSTAVEDYWTDLMTGRSATAEKGLSRRRNRVKKLRERLASLRIERAQLLTERDEVSADIDAKRNRLERDLKKHREFGARLATVESTAARARDDVKRVSNNVLGEFRAPYALSPHFAAAMVALRTTSTASSFRRARPASSLKSWHEKTSAYAADHSTKTPVAVFSFALADICRLIVSRC